MNHCLELRLSPRHLTQSTPIVSLNPRGNGIETGRRLFGVFSLSHAEQKLHEHEVHGEGLPIRDGRSYNVSDVGRPCQGLRT